MLITTMEDTASKQIKDWHIWGNEIWKCSTPTQLPTGAIKEDEQNRLDDQSLILKGWRPDGYDHADRVNTMFVCENVMPLPMDLVNIIMDLALD
jgi:hypothetical protein